MNYAIKDGVTPTYDYDVIDQLTEENVAGVWKQTYAYDANGNRTEFKRYLGGSGTPSVNDTYSYNPGDLLMSAGNKTFTYDNCGRMKTVTESSVLQKTYHYDYQDRLITTQYPDGSGTSDTYTYNGMHTRVSQTINGTTRTYKRDGTTVTAPVLTEGGRQHTPGVSYRESSATKYGFQDRLGTNTHEFNTSSVETSQKDFDAFGNEKSTSGSTNNPFGFAGNWGYQSDSSSDLQLLGHRYYDPSIGRFLTRDSIKHGRNWFAYCDNNPLKWVDPLGKSHHDPMVVNVDPNFKGKVTAVGEPGPGLGPVYVDIPAGHHSDPRMDVDYLLIEYPDGTKIIVFVCGLATPWFENDNQVCTVDANGKVHCSFMLDGAGFSSPFWLPNMAVGLDRPAPAGYGPKKGKFQPPKPKPKVSPGKKGGSVPTRAPSGHPSSRFEQ